MTEWISTSTPPADGVEVMTRIDDQKGIRNEQKLRRRGYLWFFPDMSMYVYYTPTHWRHLGVNERFSGFDGIEASR